MNAVENEDKSTAPATTFIDKVEFFDKDGKSLAAYTTPTDPTAEVTTSRAGKLNVGLEAQFDSTVGTIGEWPSLPKTTFRDEKIVLTSNTVSIHHFKGTWLPWYSKIEKRVSNILGFESKDFIRAAIYKIQLEVAKRKIKK